MRKHWLDNLRWVTVLLVLFYHVVYFYNNKGVFGGIGGFGDGPQYQDVVMYNLVVLKKRRPRVLPDEDVADVDACEPEIDTEPTPLSQEPDVVIVVNPTKANEPEGSILLYRKEGVLVYGDKQIPLDRIVDVSMNNVSNPYIPGAYHLLLALSDGQVAHIPAGQDRDWAHEALLHLREALFGKAD